MSKQTLESMMDNPETHTRLEIQNGHQKPSIEEGHTMQRPKDKRTNNDLQNTTQKTKDRETLISIKKNYGELMCSGKVNRSFVASGIRY